jgi:hypothetical protein
MLLKFTERPAVGFAARDYQCKAVVAPSCFFLALLTS